MSVQRLNSVSGQQIKWARIDAGYSEDEVARLCGISDADAVTDIESGKLKPTQLQAQKLAKRFNRPIAFFYLAKPPTTPSYEETDNRSAVVATSYSPKGRLAIRRLHLLQDYSADLTKELNEPNPILPSATIHQTPKQVAQIIDDALKITPATRWLPKQTALNSLVAKVENLGIVVSLQSMPRTELQGASSLKPYPVIVVNHSDYTSSKIFTLLHEVAHLTLRSEGVCLIEYSPSHSIEKFCNQVAGELLVPEQELIQKLGSQIPSDESTIQMLSDYFSVSKEVVLLRLIGLGKVDSSAWDALVPNWRADISKNQKIMRTASPVTRAIRENGTKFTKLVFDGFDKGLFSQSEASRYLKVRGGILDDIRGRM